MGIFVDYLNNPYQNLNNTPRTLINTSAYSHPVWVQSLIIANTGAQDIRINVQFVRTQISPDVTTTIFLVKDFLVPTARQPKEYKSTTIFNTVDLVETLGLRKNLQYTANITEKLVCFSNGYSEIFDCCIEFNVLNELPLS